MQDMEKFVVIHPPHNRTNSGCFYIRYLHQLLQISHRCHQKVQNQNKRMYQWQIYYLLSWWQGKLTKRGERWWYLHMNCCLRAWRKVRDKETCDLEVLYCVGKQAGLLCKLTDLHSRSMFYLLWMLWSVTLETLTFFFPFFVINM